MSPVRKFCLLPRSPFVFGPISLLYLPLGLNSSNLEAPATNLKDKKGEYHIKSKTQNSHILNEVKPCLIYFLAFSRGLRGEGAEPPAPLSKRAPLRRGGVSFNITSPCISLPQAIYILHCIALHSPNNILIHNNTLQSFV